MQMRVLKVAITGPESTGKTTLTKFLADYFQAPYSEEYSRQYLQQNGPDYSYQDLDMIAEGQFRSQATVIHKANEVVFFDTDLTVIKVWSQVRFGKVSDVVNELYLGQSVDLFLLPFYDVPWMYDPLRESPRTRKQLFMLYLQELNSHGANYQLIRGNMFDRNFSAIHSVRAELNQNS